MNKYTISIIGNGRWAKNHIRILSELGHKVNIFSVNSILDTSLIRKLLSCDAAVIASSSISHFAYTSLFVTNNIPVYCEKPVVVDFKQLSDLKLLRKQFPSSIFFPGHQLTFLPEILGIDSVVSFVSMRAGAIARDEGACLSLSVHDLSIIYMFLGNTLPHNFSANGDIHEFSVSLNTKGFEALLYYKSFSPNLRMRNMIISTTNSVHSINPDNWRRADVLKRSLKHFLHCVKSGRNSLINNIDSAIAITSYALLINDSLTSEQKRSAVQ